VTLLGAKLNLTPMFAYTLSSRSKLVFIPERANIIQWSAVANTALQRLCGHELVMRSNIIQNELYILGKYDEDGIL
jgi:hypothetical protein